MQYFISAWAMRLFTRTQEITRHSESLPIDGDYDKPWHLDTPAFICWNAKVICFVWTWIFIALHVLTSQVWS